MQRQFDPQTPELMDLDQPPNAELERALRNLVILNRVFGSHAIVRRQVREWFEPGGRYRVLDLATGAGDLPRVLVDEAREKRCQVRVDALDNHPTTLEFAQKWNADYPEITFHQGDARRPVFQEDFDMVMCCLALHHFSEADAARILRNCLCLTRQWALVSDLERSGLNVFLIDLLTQTLMRDRMTRHDARLSARRAFDFPEMRELCERAGWRGFQHRRCPIARQAVWIDLRNAIESDIPAMAGDMPV